MSLKTLTTEMRELSSNYQDNLLINEYIGAEIAKLQTKKQDIITYACMPGTAVMGPVIEAWWQSYMLGVQSENPTAPGFGIVEDQSGMDILIEWRSPLWGSQDNPDVYGDVNNPASTLDGWRLEKWKIKEYRTPSGGSGNQWLSPLAGQSLLLSLSYESDLTGTVLESLGFDSSYKTTLDTYADQWDFGMEWLHARATKYNSDGSVDSANPYAGDLRGFGLNEQIEHNEVAMESQNTNTDFYLNASSKWDTLLP